MHQPQQREPDRNQGGDLEFVTELFPVQFRGNAIGPIEAGDDIVMLVDDLISN